MKLHKTVFKNYGIVALLLGLGTQAYAQEDPTKPVTVDSFDVVRDYKPILADAVKIRRSPDMTNKRSYMPKLNYGNIPDKKLDINTGLKELNVQELPFTKLQDNKSNFVKVGVGNLGTILGEAYLAIEDYENIRFGGYAKHINQKGNLDAQKYSREEIGVFGRRIFSQFTVDGTLGYNRYATNFYGNPVDINNLPLNVNKLAQHFNDIFFVGELVSNYDPNNPNAFSYSAKLDAYTFKDKFKAGENSVALSGNINKRVKTFNIGINAAVDINTIDGAANTAASKKYNNSLATVNPYISFKGNNYTLTLGANIVSEFGDSSRFNVFPAAEVDFSVVPGYVHIFGGITGGAHKASFKRFAELNPYLGPALNYQNMLERLSAFGGVKGNVGAAFGYKAKLMYKTIEGLPLFVNDMNTPYQFAVVYDGNADKKVTYVGIEGEMNVRLSQLVNIGGRINIDNYTTSTQEEAWFTPKLRFAANARFNISEKLYIDAEALFHGLSYAKAYEYDLNQFGPTTPAIPGSAYKATIPEFFDLSGGAEYKATSQLGVFVKVNNIFNKEYQRYLYYPRMGFNMIGGINYSF